jgi:hypothetical protein
MRLVRCWGLLKPGVYQGSGLELIGAFDGITEDLSRESHGFGGEGLTGLPPTYEEFGAAFTSWKLMLTKIEGALKSSVCVLVIPAASESFWAMVSGV